MAAIQPPGPAAGIEAAHNFVPGPADIVTQRLNFNGIETVLLHCFTSGAVQVQFWTREAWREKLTALMAEETGIETVPAAKLLQLPHKP